MPFLSMTMTLDIPIADVTWPMGLSLTGTAMVIMFRAVNQIIPIEP